MERVSETYFKSLNLPNESAPDDEVSPWFYPPSKSSSPMLARSVALAAL